MTLIGLLILLVVIGLIVAFVPMDPQYKRIIFAIVILFVVLVILQWFGLLSGKGIPLK